MGYDLYLEEENNERDEQILTNIKHLYDFGHSVSWNVNVDFQSVTDNLTLKELLDGKRAGDTIHPLESVASKLKANNRNDSEQIRKSSRIANELADFAKLHPDAKWDII